MDEAWKWIEKHPWATGGIVFVGGIVIYYLLFSGSSSTTAASSTDPYSAYYDALAASTASGNSLAAVQNQSAAQVQAAQITSTAQTQLSADQLTASNQASADQLAATISTNNAAVQIANVQASSANYAATIANNQGTIAALTSLGNNYLAGQTAVFNTATQGLAAAGAAGNSQAIDALTSPPQNPAPIQNIAAGIVATSQWSQANAPVPPTVH